MANATAYDTVMPILERGRGETERIPCINSTSVATIDFMNAVGARWPAAHKDASKMAKLASAAHRLCGLDNVSVPFCLTVEAEVLGAPVEFFPDTVKWPTVKRFIATDPADLTVPTDLATAGRIPVITKAIHHLKQEFEGKMPVIAYLCCPFESISSYLVDSVEFLKKCKTEPEAIHEFMKTATPYYAEIANTFKEAGADIITFREEAVSLNNIHPRYFDELVKPYLKDLIGQVKPPRILHACGQLWSPALEMVSRLVKCGANALTIEESTPMDQAREIADRINAAYPLGGNINAYRVIHQGPPELIAQRVRDAIKQGSDMPMPGCDFWLETPTGHVRAFVDAVREYGDLGTGR
jgi:[methyl-Co(III) methanol-specific corrinoid protein]:coenzyme M methyltransferase